MTNLITPALVKELRERTGVGMMECKKALVASNGDIEKAIEDLRKAGQAKAVKKGDRIAAEGLVVIGGKVDSKVAVILEVNCETDFVAREEKFKQFANDVAEVALDIASDDLDVISKAILKNKKSVADNMLQLISTLGEKIALRRCNLIKAETGGVLGTYLHGNIEGARIGAIVAINQNDAILAKDLAMHVAAMKPEYIGEQDIPADRLSKEREIFLAETKENNQGKPAEILEKIVAGKVKKFTKEVTLLGQEFVRDSAQTIEQLVKTKNASITSMLRYEVGEGIEKKENNFIADVMAQVN